MSHACILNEVFSNLVYMLDESKTAKNTKYFEPVLNSYEMLIVRCDTKPALYGL